MNSWLRPTGSMRIISISPDSIPGPCVPSELDVVSDVVSTLKKYTVSIPSGIVIGSQNSVKWKAFRNLCIDVQKMIPSGTSETSTDHTNSYQLYFQILGLNLIVLSDQVTHME